MLRSIAAQSRNFREQYLKSKNSHKRIRYTNVTFLVELVGIEPTTSSLRTMRSTNWAITPSGLIKTERKQKRQENKFQARFRLLNHNLLNALLFTVFRKKQRCILWIGLIKTKKQACKSIKTATWRVSFKDADEKFLALPHCVKPIVWNNLCRISR